MEKKSHTEINWAVPSEEDLAYLKSLSRQERTKLLMEHVDAGWDSPAGNLTMEEIWEEAVKRAKSAA